MQKQLGWRVLVGIPILSFLLAYGATTVLAATAYAVIPGATELMKNLGAFLPGEVAQDIGSPIYFALLFLPLLIVPSMAWATASLVRPIFRSARVLDCFRSMKISRAGLIVLIVASFGYCALRLSQFHALNFDLLTCGEPIEKMQARMFLLDTLGFVYFMFAYGVNMMLPLLAYLAYKMQGLHKVDLGIFVVSFLGMVLFVFQTYSKAPLFVFVLMMICTVLVARAPLRHLLIAGLVCIAAFFAVSQAVYFSKSCDAGPNRQVVQSVKAAPSGLSAPSAKAAASGSAAPIVEPKLDKRTNYFEKLIGSNAVQRIAIGFPFYVHTYSDVSERCGIQGSMLRSILGIGPAKCIMATRVFKKIYPGVTWVDGSQPAPASISAYGELGFIWALAVMALSGMSLGLLGAFAASGNGPLMVAVSAASSGFGYYLTQVPFIASFTYPHGLFAFLIPVAFLGLVALFSRKSSRRA